MGGGAHTAEEKRGNDGANLPSVSVLIPCFNEAAHIERAVRSVVEGGYPAELLEVFVVDGISTDGTREILSRLRAQMPSLHVIDNPGASKPVGLNKGIKLSKGEIIVRVDAHAEYSPDYLKALIEAKQRTGADNVGPIRINVPKTNGLLARCFANVLGSAFGVGNARYNTGVDAPTWTDIVFLFCVSRTLFDQVGQFDERLTRGQDREFNLRLRRHGLKGLTTNQAKVIYYARDKPLQFARWAMECGRVPFQISGITKERQTSLRNYVPPVGLVAAAILTFLSFFVPWMFMILAGLVAVYGACATWAGAAIAWKQRSLGVALLMPLAFGIWHLSYALGGLSAMASLLRSAAEGPR